MSTGLDRRRSPRIPVARHQFLPAVLKDISLGGFSLELPQELAQGSIHDFDLRVGEAARIVLRARVAHTTPVEGAEGPEVFLTGLEFLEDVTDDLLRKSA